ncbi:MAG: hypothetical protein FJW86_09395 [Actinobacteria bacterium]|nr:hypothetical protein [Actinomycetota bacterium]
MTLPPTGRAARRQTQKRRRMALGAGALGAVVVIGGVAVALGGGGGDNDTKEATKPTTSTSSSTTSTTVPVPTTVVPKSSNLVTALAQQYDGYYEGTFTNTSFDTTGTATLLLRIDPVANTMTITSDFDGDMFGGGAKEIRKIESTIQLGDPNATVATRTTAFGAVTGRIDPSLALILTAPDVPGAQVASFELTGTLKADRTGFDATYSVIFEDGSTADGTVTLTCSANKQRPSEVQTLCTPPA